MSAQHRGPLQWLKNFLNPPVPQFDWQPTQKPEPAQSETPPSVPVYPILPPKPYRPGDTVHRYHKTHPTGPMKPVTTSLLQLPPEKLQDVVTKMPPRTIAAWQIENIPTAKTLDISQLPPHIAEQVGQIPASSGRLNMDEVHHRLSAPRLQTIRPEQVSKPLWMNQCTPLSTDQLPDWLTKEPPVPPKKPSGFLLSAHEVILSEEEMKPDLSEDPDATMQRPRVKKEE